VALQHDFLRMILRNHALVVGKLAVDQLGNQLDRTEAQSRLVAAEFDVDRVFGIGQLARQFEHGLARQDHVELVGHAGQRFGHVGQAVAVGGDQPQLFAAHGQQQAVEVVADVLLGHRVLHQRQQTLELALRQADLDRFALGDLHAGVVLRRQGLQREAALAGAHRELAVIGVEADFLAFRQGTEDVLQLACRHGQCSRLGGADVAGGAGTDLDLDVGGEQGQRIALGFDQDVGQDGQGVTLLDDAADRLQRTQQLFAFYLH
jgi:hypothetical protein